MGIFGPPSLEKPSFFEGFKIARMFRGLHSASAPPGRYLEYIDDNAAIARLETFRNSDPRDWLARYFLGDFYMSAKNYASSLEVLQEAYDLRPKDPRSTYALATIYRKLSEAGFEGHDMSEVLPPERLEELRTANPEAYRLMSLGKVGIDPEVSADNLEEIQITVDEAAFKSIEYFEKTLELGVRREDKQDVVEALQWMYAAFPHLEAKVKARRPAVSSGIAQAQRESGALYNDAVEHYTRLRFLMENPTHYRYELGEVIRLCQWAVATDPKDGDSFVLLANGYSLLDSQVSASGLDPGFYLRWAGAILQHWADTPLSSYPFTTQKDIAEQLFQSVKEGITNMRSVNEQQLVTLLRRWVVEYLDQAISPASFAKIKEQLQNQPL